MKIRSDEVTDRHCGGNRHISATYLLAYLKKMTIVVTCIEFSVPANYFIVICFLFALVQVMTNALLIWSTVVVRNGVIKDWNKTLIMKYFQLFYCVTEMTNMKPVNQ